MAVKDWRYLCLLILVAGQHGSGVSSVVMEQTATYAVQTRVEHCRPVTQESIVADATQCGVECLEYAGRCLSYHVCRLFDQPPLFTCQLLQESGYYRPCSQESPECDYFTVPTPVTDPRSIPDMLGFWALDSTHGATDLSGNGNHGYLVGGVTPGLGVQCAAGGSLVFPGSVSSHVMIPGVAAANTGSFTVALWVRTDLNYTGPLVDLASPNIGTRMWIWYTGAVGAQIENVLGSPLAASLEVTFLGASATGCNGLAPWLHLAVMHDFASGESRMYVNGESLALIQNGPSVVFAAFTTDMYIGGSGWDSVRPYIGSIADVMLFSRALTQTEVKAVMNPDRQFL